MFYTIFSLSSHENGNIVIAFGDLSQGNINNFSEVLQDFANDFMVYEIMLGQSVNGRLTQVILINLISVSLLESLICLQLV